MHSLSMHDQCKNNLARGYVTIWSITIGTSMQLSQYNALYTEITRVSINQILSRYERGYYLLAHQTISDEKS
jgi:hypothetical protein